MYKGVKRIRVYSVGDVNVLRAGELFLAKEVNLFFLDIGKIDTFIYDAHGYVLIKFQDAKVQSYLGDHGVNGIVRWLKSTGFKDFEEIKSYNGQF